MASMERGLARGRSVKAAAKVGIRISLVRRLKVVGRGGILRI